MSNRLQYETSPYLLQHKDNPVDWYPWGKEAFDKAKTEDKPIFLSIGYSACRRQMNLTRYDTHGAFNMQSGLDKV